MCALLSVSPALQQAAEAVLSGRAPSAQLGTRLTLRVLWLRVPSVQMGTGRTRPGVSVFSAQWASSVRVGTTPWGVRRARQGSSATALVQRRVWTALATAASVFQRRESALLHVVYGMMIAMSVSMVTYRRRTRSVSTDALRVTQASTPSMMINAGLVLGVRSAIALEVAARRVQQGSSAVEGHLHAQTARPAARRAMRRQARAPRVRRGTSRMQLFHPRRAIRAERASTTAPQARVHVWTVHLPVRRAMRRRARAQRVRRGTT